MDNTYTLTEVELVSQSEIDAIVAALRDLGNAESPASFPRDREAASQPGFNAWYADDEAIDLLASVLGTKFPPLLYVGQAGATTRRSQTRRSHTLGSRVRQHIRGPVGSSTLRHTLASVLGELLGLTRLKPGSLTRDGESQLSNWVAEHLRVAILPFPDRDKLGRISQEVIGELNPPLNLKSMPSTPAREQIGRMREAFNS